MAALVSPDLSDHGGDNLDTILAGGCHQSTKKMLCEVLWSAAVLMLSCSVFMQFDVKCSVR